MLQVFAFAVNVQCYQVLRTADDTKHAQRRCYEFRKLCSRKVEITNYRCELRHREKIRLVVEVLPWYVD